MSLLEAISLPVTMHECIMLSFSPVVLFNNSKTSDQSCSWTILIMLTNYTDHGHELYWSCSRTILIMLTNYTDHAHELYWSCSLCQTTMSQIKTLRVSKHINGHLFHLFIIHQTLLICGTKHSSTSAEELLLCSISEMSPFSVFHLWAAGRHVMIVQSLYFVIVNQRTSAIFL